MKVLSGIPQGTILGPLLFISMICHHWVDIPLFADDAKVFKYIKNENDHHTLQHSLDNIYTWSENSMLKLNANKCKTVSYGRNVSTDYTYYLNGTVLARDNFILYQRFRSYI